MIKKQKLSTFMENVRVARRSLRSQLLRAVLTLMIIAIGIMALIGILTSVEAIKSSLNQEFSNLGSNTLTIRPAGRSRSGMRGGQRSKYFQDISYREAVRFKDEFDSDLAQASLSVNANFAASVRYKGEKTNPNVQLLGVDDNFLRNGGYNIAHGRDLNASEISGNGAVIILGMDVAKKLLPNALDFGQLIGEPVIVQDQKMTVVGILETKGSSFGFSADNRCLVPYTTARQKFTSPVTNFVVNVFVGNAQDILDVEYTAVGLMRVVRGDKIGEENSFSIQKSDSAAETVVGTLEKITPFVSIIGIMTLIGAGIGLMNIMLVSVTERTKEIGVRKALGASQSTIRQQFLIEAVLISITGGLVGIVLGILVGNIVGIFLNIGFTVPWLWMLMGVLLCVITGVLSGYWPARQASQLDPIEALRR